MSGRPFLRTFGSILLWSLVAGLLCVAPSGELFAQRKKAEAETLSGTVVSSEKGRGKTYTLKIKTAEDKEIDIPLTPRVNFKVVGPGDAGFLRQGVTFTSTLVTANNMLFGNKFEVYTGPAPQPGVTANPDQKEIFEVVGKVLSVEEGKMTANLGSGGTQPVMLETGYTIVVHANSPELAKPGAAVELEGKPSSGGKGFNATRITVTSAEPFKAEEFFGADDDKKPAAKSKAVKPKAEKAESGGLSGADPFGVLSGEKKPAAKTKATTKTSKSKADKTDGSLGGADPFGVLDKKKMTNKTPLSEVEKKETEKKN